MDQLKWEDLSPKSKMESAIILAAYHYITSVKAKAGNENYKLTVNGQSYTFENIRRHDNSELIWEYQRWVAQSVLRDLVENFSTFMMEVYRSAETKSSKKLNTTYEKFEKMGIERQAQVFQQNFNIDDRWFIMFDGFNRARNCLAHRQGIVSAKDANENGSLVIKWMNTTRSVVDRKITEFTESKGHYEGLIRSRHEFGNLAVDIDINSTEKRIGIGESLRFDPDEILQICSTFHFLTSVFSRIGG